MRAGRPGRWIVVASVPIVVSTLFVRCRTESAPADPVNAALAPAPRVIAEPQARAEDSMAALLAAAPELTEESARVLLGSTSQAVREVPVMARVSLLEATAGFTHLHPDDLQELSALFAAAYGHLAAADRARLESYLLRVRGGDAGSADEEARGRRLFNTAILALDPGQRSRLQSLYGRAIAGSLAAKAPDRRSNHRAW